MPRRSSESPQLPGPKKLRTLFEGNDRLGPAGESPDGQNGNPAPPSTDALSAADAEAQADAMVKVWESKDAAKIKALYAADVVAFDYGFGPLETDRTTFDTAQDVFAAAAIDHENPVSRKVQILVGGTFVVSGVWNGVSATKLASNGTVRCTDVFHRSGENPWLIVNEHCSTMPKPA